MKKRILYVDEEILAQRELLRALADMKDLWEIVLAAGGEDALALLAGGGFDAVVTDMHLPDMTGAQLLIEVGRRHPRMLRFIVADFANRQSLIQCVGVANHYLTKPWQARALKSQLERAFALEIWLTNDTVKQVVAKLTKLPSPPALYFQIVRALQSPDGELDRISGLISQDLAITAKLLQLVNSAVFGRQSRVTSAEEAILFLGMVTTKSLILLAHTFSYFDQLKAADFSVDKLWRHALLTGAFARRIVRAETRDAELAEEAFTAGLLHDLGKLLLAANLPDDFGRALALARDRHISLWEAETEVFGTTHAEIGAGLLAIWGLPMATVEALALHHYPAKFLHSEFCPLTAVHAANALEHELDPAKNGHSPAALDAGYLRELGVENRIEHWRELCREEVQQQQTA